ncbi:hypothetical protein GGS23DRAFT_145559 [Durotheca rogersii]|uniref:uncharacterized protein n=1 Tax=Durotheca rogersii TaxID=419775 RepID=UPI00221F307E|nr:uncharacterized protein GGS23DRAFT_145559 [Durotheca rogersii]KAI5861307.1 hypothetical protein GGS23DRAFT_145559 [Durotheca rogersii]
MKALLQNIVPPWPGDAAAALRANLALSLPEPLSRVPPWAALAAIAVVAYLALVRTLRFRALRALERKHADLLAPGADPYAMGYRRAAEISRLALLGDTPFLFYFGTQWALVKSYAMATGTPLLAATRQLADGRRVGRRAEDTALLLVELLAGDLDAPRGRAALARLNWLHARYAARIRPADYVHTLALFVLEPARWVARYDWRPLSPLERVAYFVYWREIARRMGFADLVPPTLDALDAWRQAYEAEHMYFVPSNRTVADATVGLFLRSWPAPLRGFARSVFLAFLDEKPVREALGYDDPPAWATALTSGILRLRGFVLRHLFLPRWAPMDPLARAGPDGRLYQNVWYVGFEPWYVADTWWNRAVLWVTTGGRVRLGGAFPGRPGGGYLPEELGPVEFEKLGQDEVREQAEAMKRFGAPQQRKDGAYPEAVGCPLAFGF